MIFIYYSINFENYKNESSVIPNNVIDNLLFISNGITLKVLLWIYRNPKKDININELSNIFKVNINDIKDSIDFLIEKKVLISNNNVLENLNNDIKEVEINKVSHRSKFDRNEINNIINSNIEIKQLISEGERIFKKIFNSKDIDSIVALSTFYNLSSFFIITCMDYCSFCNKNNTSYLEKVCVSWQENEINDDNISNYVEKLKNNFEYENLIRSTLGIYGRKFTSSEKIYITNWFNIFNYNIDIVNYAYEKMINSIGKVNFKYLNSILESWHEKELYDLEDIKKIDLNKEKISNNKFDKLIDKYMNIKD